MASLNVTIRMARWFVPTMRVLLKLAQWRLLPPRFVIWAAGKLAYRAAQVV